MSQKQSSHHSPGWLKAAAGIGVPGARQPGWLKSAALQKSAQPGNYGMYGMYGGAPAAPQQPKEPDITERQRMLQRKKLNAEQAQISRDWAARAFQLERFMEAQGRENYVPPPASLEETGMEFATDEERQAAQANLDAYTEEFNGHMQELEQVGFGEKDLAEQGYAFNPYVMEGQGSAFEPVGSGRGTAMDIDMAKQHYKTRRGREDAYISGDAKKIMEAEQYDGHDFVGGPAGRNLIPANLDDTPWQDGMAMVDYSGGQQSNVYGHGSDIGSFRSMGMGIGGLFNFNDQEDAGILNHRADNDLKMGNWNQYEKRIREAVENQLEGEEVPAYLQKKYDNLDKDRRKFGVQMWADKYVAAKGPTAPSDYDMPPRPPEGEYPEAAAMWDDVQTARERGALIPYQWEPQWGEEPAPIRENWTEWYGSETNPETGEIEYKGKRRPEHQKLLDKKAERERKVYEESGQAQHDQMAQAYDAEMVDPRQQLLTKYHSTDDPAVKEQIHKLWNDQKAFEETESRLSELYKDEDGNKDEIERLEEYKQQQFNELRESGYSQRIYDTARDADQLQVDEWDSKANELTMAYYDDDSLKGVHKTPGDYLKATMGEEPPAVAEARTRVRERRANEESMGATFERVRNLHKQEDEQAKEFKEAAILSQYESGNADSPQDLDRRINQAAEEFTKHTRKVRIRALQASNEGKFDEAAELMARRDLMFKAGMRAVQSGGADLNKVTDSLSSMSNDKEWAEQRGELLQDPEFKDLAKGYVDGVSKHSEDFKTFQNSDLAKRKEALKTRIARFDKGQAQRMGLTPGNYQPGQAQQPDQAMADNEAALELPPIGQEAADKHREELAKGGGQKPATPGQPEAPAQPTTPDQPNTPGQPETPGQPKVPGQPETGGMFANYKPQVPDNAFASGQDTSGLPAAAQATPHGGTQPQDPAAQKPVGKLSERIRNKGKEGQPGAPGQPQQVANASSLWPNRFRKPGDSNATDASTPGQGGALAATPPAATPGAAPEAPMVPGAPPVVGNTAQPGGDQGAGTGPANSLGASNEANAGVQKKTTLLGQNRQNTPQAPGNPHGLQGIGNQRMNPNGNTPGQLAKFTVGTAGTKSLDSNLLPKKQIFSPNAAGGAKMGSLKLADFKGAKYMNRPSLDGMKDIPLVGGMLHGVAKGVDNAQRFSSTGNWGRAALGVGQAGLNAGLMAASVVPVGQVAGWGARGLFAGGRALLGRAAAKQVGSTALSLTGNQAAKATAGQAAKQFGSRLLTKEGLKTTGKRTGKFMGGMLGWGTAYGVNDGLFGTIDQGSIAHMRPDYTNSSSLRDRLKQSVPKAIGNKTLAKPAAPSLSLLD